MCYIDRHTGKTPIGNFFLNKKRKYLEVLERKPYKEYDFSLHTGNMVTEPSEITAICQSLQQVAEKCQQDPESYWYFHKTAVPCLFGLAVQASMPGNFLCFIF